MIENLNKLSNNALVLTLISAIATILSSYFYFGSTHQETAKSVATLIVYFIILSFFIYQRLQNSFKTDIALHDGQRLNILILYSEKENDTNLINTIVGKYSNQALTFINFKVDIKDQNIFFNLENILKSTDGIYCFWNEEIKSQYQSYISLIEDWLKQYEAKPFIIIASESDLDEKIRSQYRVLDKEQAENSLPILLSRSISRTKRFISDAKTWRLAFISSSIVFFSIIIIFIVFYPKKDTTFNTQIVNNTIPHSQSKLLFERLSGMVPKDGTSVFPNTEVNNYINGFIEYKSKQLGQILKDPSIEISLWRTDSKNMIINRITETSTPYDSLKFKSVAGCACDANQNEDKLIVGWKNEDGDSIKNFWSRENMLVERFVDFRGNCMYSAYKPKKAILSLAIRLIPSGRYNVVCIDSESSSNIVSDEFSNEVAKSFIVEIANFTSIIPNEVLDEKTFVQHLEVRNSKTSNKKNR